jgi:hypothetical protein
MINRLLLLLCCISSLQAESSDGLVAGLAVAQNNYRFYLTQVINRSSRVFKLYCRKPKNYWRSPVLAGAPTECSVLTPPGQPQLGNSQIINPPSDRVTELYRLWQGDPNSGINNRITILENNQLSGAANANDRERIHKEIAQLKRDRDEIEEYLRPIIRPVTTEKVDFECDRLQCRIFSEDDRPKIHVMVGTGSAKPDMAWIIPPTYLRSIDTKPPLTINVINTACTTRNDKTHERAKTCSQDMAGCLDCPFGSTLLKATASNGKSTCLCVPNRADILEIQLHIDNDIDNPAKPGGLKLVPIPYTKPIEGRTALPALRP